MNCDQEFKSLLDPIMDDMDIIVNYTATEEHVPEAERNNRTIAERIRTTYHNLPYQTMPKVMFKYLAMVCTHQLNLFPAKGGVSEYFSPHMLVGGRNLDFNKHCQITFGSYVQANQDNNPKNTNSPRTIDAIYLRPIPSNMQGGHEVMDLTTGRVLTRSPVWDLPITQLIINKVEQMGEDQGMKSLKLQGRHKTYFYPADWIAGVDYQNENENYNDDDENNYNTNTNNNENDNESYENESEENENEEDDELEDDNYDRIEQAEIDEILGDDNREEHANTNPTKQGRDENMEEEEINFEPDEEEMTPLQTTQPTRIQPQRTRQPPERLTYERPQQSTHFIDKHIQKVEEYNVQLAALIARCIIEINIKTTTGEKCFGQQYILQKGLKVFGTAGAQGAQDELEQLHKRNCFTPIDFNNMPEEEKMKAMEALMFLTEKRDKSIKGRMVYNGKPTREWLSREDSASPTVALESILLTATIDAYERRDVMTGDIPNAFIQAYLPVLENGKEKVIMKITGVLVDLLVELAPEIYSDYIVYENGKKVLYVQVLRALYGMLVAALLWYKKFKNDLEQEGFEFNPYDSCVANKMVNGSQHTIRFHVDDLMSSHIDKKVNDEFEQWLNKNYGTHGAVKTTRGKIHDYLGMTFDFTNEGKVIIDMKEYVQAMLDDFSVKFQKNEKAITPASENLFQEANDDIL